MPLVHGRLHGSMVHMLSVPLCQVVLPKVRWGKGEEKCLIQSDHAKPQTLNVLRTPQDKLWDAQRRLAEYTACLTNLASIYIQRCWMTLNNGLVLMHLFLPRLLLQRFKIKAAPVALNLQRGHWISYTTETRKQVQSRCPRVRWVILKISRSCQSLTWTHIL